MAEFGSSGVSAAGRVPGDDGIIEIDGSGFWKHRSPPTRSLEKAAALFQQIGGQTIVEIGTGIHGEMSGNSMLVWCRRTSARKIVAVDMEQTSLDEVAERTKEFDNVALVLGDGLQYLRDCEAGIDLLYLDFWTPDADGALPGMGRANAYRAAYAAARDKMSPRSLILIDDTDHVHPWKHSYIVPDARADGFVVLHEGRQTLMLR